MDEQQNKIGEIISEFDAIRNKFNEQYLALKEKYGYAIPINIWDGGIGYNFNYDALIAIVEGKPIPPEGTPLGN